MPAPAPSREPVQASTRTAPAVDVLHDWDRARARAFARGDTVALRRLYTSRSRAGTADVRTLRQYVRRGLRVEGMRMQLLAVDVLEQGSDRIQLRVTDRLADGAVAVDATSRLPLPDDVASTRVVELVRRDGSGPWQVASVSPTAPP
jgi:ribosomal protein L31E